MNATTFSKPRNKAEKVQRLREVLGDIEKNPQQWDQTLWHCGTSYCFAGFARLRAYGLSPQAGFTRDADIPRTARKSDGSYQCPQEDAILYLGLTAREASCFGGLFDPDNKLPDLRRIIKKIESE